LPVGLSICEDLWNDERLIARRLYHQNPIQDLSTAGAQVMIKCKRFAVRVGKHDFEIELFGRAGEAIWSAAGLCESGWRE